MLIRRSRMVEEQRNVFLAVPETGLLAHWYLPIDELGALDFDGIIGGRVNAPRTERELTLVCTNGKRDQCCAIDGRALVEDLADVSDVWECSHIGGHRFAPVVLHLPDGHVYGRVSAADARLIAAGQIPPTPLRGVSHHASKYQAGLVGLRHEVEGLGPYDVHWVTEDVDGAIIASTDSGRWRITLHEVPAERIESCGAPPVAAMGWRVDTVAALQ